MPGGKDAKGKGKGKKGGGKAQYLTITACPQVNLAPLVTAPPVPSGTLAEPEAKPLAIPVAPKSEFSEPAFVGVRNCRVLYLFSGPAGAPTGF
jgi:hypothetical protein